MTSASVLAPLGASGCPVCRADHEHLDQFWACPKHGHKLGTPTPDGDWETRCCPVPSCKYTRSAPRPPRNPAKGDPMTTAITRPSVAVDTMRERAQHLYELLPPGLDVGSFMGSAQAALYNNPALLAAADSDKGASLMIALTECAALGHMPGSKEYYLTPRGNKVLGIEGYRGIVQRMYNSGQVAKVTWREVCERDDFDFVDGRDDYPVHHFGDSAEKTGAGFFGAQGSVHRGEMVGVYAYAKLINGGYTRVALLSREDVFARRASGGWKPTDPYSPWNRADGGPDHPEFRGRSMWWKSALKAAEPAVPTSSEDKRVPAVHAEQVHERPSVTLTAPPAPPAVTGNGKRQALPAGRQKPAQRQDVPKDGAVIKALNVAIGKQFDKLGLDDRNERSVYVRRLNQDATGELTEDQLRFALGALGECEDLGALVELCDPGTPAEPEGDIEVPF